MKIITSKKKLIKILQDNKNIGFVPTMGAIHKAHVSLIKKSKNLCGKTVVTIFINKPQFNRIKDFIYYPRVIKKDISLLRKYKVDFLYLPSMKQIYPKGPNKKIKISPLCQSLCGKSRPRHFHAVVDVVDRFIKIIKPSMIFLGQKDMQQLKIIEDYLKRNKIKTKVVACKTVREKNGLACSSRNILLSSNEKLIAAKIYNFLNKNKMNLCKYPKLLIKIKKKILKFGASKIDYLKILDINKMIMPHKKNSKYKIFIAYYLSQTRLIDNI